MQAEHKNEREPVDRLVSAFYIDGGQTPTSGITLTGNFAVNGLGVVGYKLNEAAPAGAGGNIGQYNRASDCYPIVGSDGNGLYYPNANPAIDPGFQYPISTSPADIQAGRSQAGYGAGGYAPPAALDATNLSFDSD